MRPTLWCEIIFKHNVAKVQYAGHNAVDGEFLGVTEAHVRHGLVGQLEVPDVVQLDVAQAALSQELVNSAPDNLASWRTHFLFQLVLLLTL